MKGEIMKDFCKAITKRGNPCKNEALKNGFCELHLNTNSKDIQKNLKVFINNSIKFIIVITILLILSSVLFDVINKPYLVISFALFLYFSLSVFILLPPGKDRNIIERTASLFISLVFFLMVVMLWDYYLTDAERAEMEYNTAQRNLEKDKKATAEIQSERNKFINSNKSKCESACANDPIFTYCGLKYPSVEDTVALARCSRDMKKSGGGDSYNKCKNSCGEIAKDMYYNKMFHDLGWE